MTAVTVEQVLDQLRHLLDFDGHTRRVAIVRGGLAAGQIVVHCEFGRIAEESGAVVLSAAATPTDGPLGVLERLLAGAPGVAEFAAQRAELLRSGCDSGVFGISGEVLKAFEKQLCELLVDVSGDRPIVLLVDDFHFADVETARVLVGLLRSGCATRLLLVVTESGWVDPTRPRSSWELVKYPHIALTLAPLSEADVAAELARAFDSETARHHAPTFHELSGGNPMLVSALIEDNRTTDAAAAVAGAAYGQAILAIVDGTSSRIAALARGVAVLDEDATPALLCRLTGSSGAVTENVLAILNRSGVLHDGRFRHPMARTALLESVPPAARTSLHIRAAELLYASGAIAGVVARQLVAAGQVPGSWGHAVLVEAADHALKAGEATFATRCLSLAHRNGDADEREKVASSLARAGWRVSPTEAAGHVSALREAAAAGTLVARDAVTLIRYSLWNGEVELATAALRRVTETLDPRERAELRTAWGWLYATAPPELVGDDPWGRTVEQLGTIWISGDNPVARSAAETLLRNIPLADCSLEMVATAVAVLAIGGMTESAGRWCDDLIETASARGAVTWEAVLRAMRGYVLFRRGELIRGAAQAEAAFAMLDPRGWGVMIGVPLEMVVLLNTAVGRHDRAAKALEHPVPEAMFTTVAGLRYLFARGQHHLANDKVLAAITDFGQCERLAGKLERDLPAMIPWRTSLAEAQLLLGDVEAARQLVLDQLDRIDPDDARTRGTALRVLAAASTEPKRAALLDEAVTCLVGVGDPVELTETLSALADLHGEGDAAWGRLRRLTDPAGLDALVATVCRVHQARGEFDRVRALSTWARERSTVDAWPPAGVREELSVRVLSDAERRVAELAARGHSNREIGRKLYVTISTVEQHLTRVYRKLGVDGRAHLPVELAT